MTTDFLDELGELALGSRMKRMSEKMLADAASVYQHFGMDIQPKWFTLLALLDQKHQVSVVEASEYLGLSQPALSQFCRQLVSEQLVEVKSMDTDSRRKIMSLSAQGRAKVAQMQPVWEAVDNAAKELCEEAENNFYQAFLVFEKAHKQRSLLTRTQDFFATNTVSKVNPNAVSILDYNEQLAPYFESINSQWIEHMFVLEEVDKQVLQYPQQNIIDKGGKIWFAEHQKLGLVGACALLNKGDGAYELTKMGVLEKARGFKVGELLLKHVIAQANTLDLSCLFLLTNAKCEAAIHLYEKNGFVHDKAIMEKYGKSYQRCDVAMRWIPS